MLADFLAAINVADVHLDGGDLRTGEGVAQGEAGMGEGAGVDNDAMQFAVGIDGVDFVDDEAFVVGLVKLYGDAESLCFFGEAVLEVGQGFVSVDVGFANAEAVEVGAVDDSDAFHLKRSLAEGRGKWQTLKSGRVGREKPSRA